MVIEILFGNWKKNSLYKQGDLVMQLKCVGYSSILLIASLSIIK